MRSDQPAGDSRPLSEKPFFLVVVGASAGGLKALTHVLSALPATFPAPILVVQHLSAHSPSVMAEILARRTRLHVKQARDGDQLVPGVVYVAPPDFHLVVSERSSLSLVQTEQVHYTRPSVNRLFETAALGFGDYVIAVVLTGLGSDGADGVVQVKRMGGTVIAQDQTSSDFFGMPEAAIKTGCVDFILPVDEIAARLITLTESETAT